MPHSSKQHNNKRTDGPAMPFTPLHLGIAAPVKAAFPSRFSLVVFAMSQVLMDTEPLVKLLSDRDDLHALTHNPPGALAIALATVLLWYALIAIKPRNLFKQFNSLTPAALILSALYGTVTHLWLDSLYHADVAESMKWFDMPGRSIGAELLSAFALFVGLLVGGIRHAVSRRIGVRKLAVEQQPD